MRTLWTQKQLVQCSYRASANAKLKALVRQRFQTAQLMSSRTQKLRAGTLRNTSQSHRKLLANDLLHIVLLQKSKPPVQQDHLQTQKLAVARLKNCVRTELYVHTLTTERRREHQASRRLNLSEKVFQVVKRRRQTITTFC